MSSIREKVEELRAAIEESEEYQSFQEARRQVDTMPGLAEKIREFCWKNYELQKHSGENLYELMGEFEAQYEDFRRNPVVKEYLERELHMCRVMQEIHARLLSVMDLLI